MRFYTWFLALAAVSTSLAADSIPLWPHAAPGEKGDIAPETNSTPPGGRLVDGKTVTRVVNVSNPTITIYSPRASKNSGAAVVVCPGGGYGALAYDLEGTEVCKWLNSIGVTGVLLKYRVPVRAGRKNYEAPLQDAQRALSLVRSRAATWRIDTNRVGILGFSAGGHLSAVAGCQFDKRTYEAVDAADELSCRPDFVVLVYPAYLTLKTQLDKISPELTITSNTPPTILIQTEDDPVHVESSLYYYAALKNAHVPAEMHIFSEGGHGYGLRPSGKPVSTWPKLVEQWLRTRGILRSGR